MNINAPKPAARNELRALWREAFGDTSQFLDTFEEYAFSTDRARCAVIDDTVVGALYWFDASLYGERVAYLYAIATKKEYRGRGICSLLVKDTLSHLSENAYTGAILVPSEESLFDFYERLGFLRCSTVREIHAEAKEPAVKLREIDACEYGDIRRELLPKNSVIQEGENLSFLAATSELYRGDGFLLCAVRDGDTLRCTELLGDTDNVGGIVTALGCKHGVFRTVGDDKDFAMYHSLTGKALTSKIYFGLAFD